MTVRPAMSAAADGYCCLLGILLGTQTRVHPPAGHKRGTLFGAGCMLLLDYETGMGWGTALFCSDDKTNDFNKSKTLMETN